MEEAAAVHVRLNQMGDQMRTWAPASASFAEEAQRSEQFLDGARAQIEALAAQVLPWPVFGGVRPRALHQSSMTWSLVIRQAELSCWLHMGWATAAQPVPAGQAASDSCRIAGCQAPGALLHTQSRSLRLAG